MRKVRTLGVLLVIIFAMVIGFSFVDDIQQESIPPAALTPATRRAFDLRTKQQPLEAWPEVQRVYRALPRVGQVEIAISSYRPYWGSYAKPASAPSNFIRVDAANRFRYVFRNWRLEDFLSSNTRFDSSLWAQYLALNECLLEKLQVMFDRLKAKKLDLSAVRIGHGFRTPKRAVELAQVNSRAASDSQHMYGTAIDLHIGDLNRDGRQDLRDRRIIEQVLNEIDHNPTYRTLWGGMGTYEEPWLLHVDCRGKCTRWGQIAFPC